VRRALAVLVVLVAAGAGVYLVFFERSGSGRAVRGTTPSAHRIAALVARREINEPGNMVTSVRCRSAGYAGYRCAVDTNDGRFVCDANGSLTGSALLTTPVVGDRLTLLMCDRKAHYDASRALTRSFARRSLEAINRSVADRRLLRRLAKRSTSMSCSIYRLRIGRSMTRVVEVTLIGSVGQLPSARQTGAAEFVVLPSLEVRRSRPAGLVQPLAPWRSCVDDPRRGIALEQAADWVWPVLYTKEAAAGSA
jgi:cytochrome P450